MRIPDGWSPLQGEHSEPYFTSLTRKVAAERETTAVYPSESNVFRALQLTPLESVRVVILGQDPYHGPGQANGLAFSCEKSPLPPSLRNIFKELETDLGKPRTNGNLDDWAAQGALLLNTTLTVRAGQPLSHAGLGWETFTDRVVNTVASHNPDVIWVLWGRHAQSKATGPGIRIEAPHPSPLSAYRGFFGSRPFSTINRHLTAAGSSPIRWA